ncbi:ser thr protein phosphatase [Colletotrichum sojae]|uniref:Ser thr protein phosphatase n=1 Tax=Colletotrichum sojae TaxID=2175907 RepID=A0A8H6J6Y1_9PEZI|nr:ser thr protein phosphatase [Colletotrichum sojae]
MSIQILSDLHLESPKAYDIFEVVPKAPILALLGDIGYVGAHKDDYLTFLSQQLSQFRAVLLVPGNHEAYRSTWPQTLAILRALEEETNSNPKLGQFVLLDRTVFRVPESDIVVLGCSLFSHVPPESADVVSMGLNDFFQTGEDWDVAAHNAAHARDVAWLNECVTELGLANARIIVFSHWSPSGDSRSVDPRHAGSPIGPGFATDLSGEACFASPRVKVWAFGHTHYNCDFTVERTDSGPLRLVTNQRGYYFAQAAGFDAERVLSLDG